VDKNDPASWPGPTDYPDWADAYFSDQLLLGQYTANEELYGWCQPDSSWRCPSDVAFRDERSRDHVSYGLCTRSYPWISKSKGWSRMWKIDRVRSSTKMLAFLDSTISRFHPGHGKDPPFFGNIEPMVKGRQDAWAFGVPESNYNHSLRHVNQTTNCSFLDGHVSNLTDLYHAFRTGKLVIDHKAQ
jgi:prepilin-type processing-associated H-X9-DG protein